MKVINRKITLLVELLLSFESESTLKKLDHCFETKSNPKKGNFNFFGQK